MSFVAILISIVLDHFLRHLEHLRAPRWFIIIQEGFSSLTKTKNDVMAAVSALVMVLLPALVIALIDVFLNGLWLALGFAFSVVVLLFTLGPQDVISQAERYADALDVDDQQTTNAIAGELLGEISGMDTATRTEYVAEAVLIHVNDRLFAILFWFAVLGPFGAVMYRCAHLLNSNTDGQGESSAFRAAAVRLYGVLAWVPAHLTALAYALAGSFDEAVSGMRDYYKDCTASFFEVNSQVLVCTGRGALEHSETAKDSSARIRAAVRLVYRSLLIWLVPLAILTLAGWWM